MRHVRISQTELRNLRKLYEGVMSHACHGLFFREGALIGAEIVDLAIKDREKFFEVAKKELVERGWLQDVTFGDNKITVKGSIEVSENDVPTCHRLRGIMRHLYEAYQSQRIHCVEKKCESVGDEDCVFNIEPIE